MTTIFNKDYTGDDLSDINRDILEVFDDRFNPSAKALESDEHGIIKGTIKITIEYSKDD